MTDNTLVQLSIHCPRLQALVNTTYMLCVSFCTSSRIHTEPYLTQPVAPLAVPVTLWVDHRRRHQSLEQQHLWPGAPHGGGAGQLPPHNRRDAGAPEELPSAGAHWTLRLSASHQGWNQTHSGQWKSFFFFFFFTMFSVGFTKKSPRMTSLYIVLD